MTFETDLEIMRTRSAHGDNRLDARNSCIKRITVERFAPHARLNNIYTDEVEVLYMKKLITILLISTLLTAFAMADAGDTLPDAIVMRGIAVSMDLDGDGKEETLRWDLVDVDEYTSSLTLTVVDTEGTQINYPTELIGGQAVYATDMDGDGVVEILLTGDIASDDYYTTCLHFVGGTLVSVPFADGNRGDNGSEYLAEGYGMVMDISGNALSLSGSQDILGTWFATRIYALVDGRFDFADEGEWVRVTDTNEPGFWEDNYGVLTTTTPLDYTAVDGSAAQLPEGARLMIVASDKQSYARFITPEGIIGTLTIAPNKDKGWGMTVNGIDENSCFEYIPYAD